MEAIESDAWIKWTHEQWTHREHQSGKYLNLLSACGVLLCRHWLFRGVSWLEISVECWCLRTELKCMEDYNTNCYPSAYCIRLFQPGWMLLLNFKRKYMLSGAGSTTNFTCDPNPLGTFNSTHSIEVKFSMDMMMTHHQSPLINATQRHVWACTVRRAGKNLQFFYHSYHIFEYSGIFFTFFRSES